MQGNKIHHNMVIMWCCISAHDLVGLTVLYGYRMAMICCLCCHDEMFVKFRHSESVMVETNKSLLRVKDVGSERIVRIYMLHNITLP